MLTGASDLASPFFTPRVFLDGIYFTAARLIWDYNMEH